MTQPTAEHRTDRIRSEYKAVSAEVKDLLASLTEADMNRPTNNPGWSVGKVAAHLASSPGQIAPFTRRAAAGKWMPPLPMFAINLGNRFGQFRARNKTLAELREEYHEGSAALLEVIDESRTGNWDREFKMTGQRHTLESWFDTIGIGHEREHLEQIRSGLTST